MFGIDRRLTYTAYINKEFLHWDVAEFEDTKGNIRIRKEKKDRQHNGHKIPKGGNQNP